MTRAKMTAPYRRVLRVADFRLLWLGALVSLLGDGATWTALAWITVSRGGPHALTLLAVCYFAPIVLGGWLAGKVVDRFSRRRLLVADSLVRATAVAAIPVTALTGPVSLWLVYAVAAVYGLFKIFPIGIIPAVIPDLVSDTMLAPAIALESVAYGAAGLAGPALGGLLIPVVGAPAVVALDAASYLVFAACIMHMQARLDRPRGQRRQAAVEDQPGPDGARCEARAGSWRPVIGLIVRDRVLLAFLFAFPAFNIAMGMLTVVQPWLAHGRLPGGATTLGVLVGVLAAAELLGSLAGGVIRPATRPVLRIGVLQMLCGAALLLLVGAHLPLIIAGEIACALPAGIASVSTQAVRYQHIAPELRARTMTLISTLVLGAVPLGSLVAGPLLAGGHYDLVVVLMAAFVGPPGAMFVVLGLGAGRDSRRTPAQDGSRQAGTLNSYRVFAANEGDSK